MYRIFKERRMKKIINAIRDFLYNITDYGLIIAVVVIMVVILGWRFDILFSKGVDKEVIPPVNEIPVKNNPDAEKPDPDSPEEPGGTDEEPNTTPGENSGTVLIATIKIPDGSYPSTIGDILLNSNLIKDKNEFLNRSVALGLDTRLRSGTYEIEVGTSVDDIIKILANAQ